MNCEMCGIEASKLITIEIEGTNMKVCESCSKFGKEVIVKNEKKIPPNVEHALKKRIMRTKSRDILIENEEMELAFDYSKRIRKARESLGLTQEELGKKISEKKSIITKLEGGHLRPDDKTLKKLEKVLGISLLEPVQKVEIKPKHNMQNFTIGDLIKK